jgi:hypothetical protein
MRIYHSPSPSHPHPLPPPALTPPPRPRRRRTPHPSPLSAPSLVPCPLFIDRALIVGFGAAADLGFPRSFRADRRGGLIRGLIRGRAATRVPSVSAMSGFARYSRETNEIGDRAIAKSPDTSYIENVGECVE